MALILREIVNPILTEAFRNQNIATIRGDKTKKPILFLKNKKEGINILIKKTRYCAKTSRFFNLEEQTVKL